MRSPSSGADEWKTSSTVPGDGRPSWCEPHVGLAGWRPGSSVDGESRTVFPVREQAEDPQREAGVGVAEVLGDRGSGVAGIDEGRRFEVSERVYAVVGGWGRRRR